MSQASPDFTKYPPAQKAAYLGAIASLITADRQATQPELDFLSKLAQATGMSPDEAKHVEDAALDPSNGSLTKSLTMLKTSDLRFSLVQDLISFAQSDGQDEQRQVRLTPSDHHSECGRVRLADSQVVSQPSHTLTALRRRGPRIIARESVHVSFSFQN